MNITIWHNQSCSTSRNVLNFLETKSKEIQIRNYISEPPSIDELNELSIKLGDNFHDIIRKKDKIYIEKFKDKKLTKSQWIKTLSENPTMIERPIVLCKDMAWIARPLDKFKEEFVF